MEKKARSDLSRARDRISWYLAQRDHSRFELRTKLSRAFPPEIVDQVMNEAEEHRLIAPEDEIAARMALSLQRRNKSRMYIEGQLRKKRLPLPAFDDEAELESVRTVLERKFGPAHELSFEQRTKAYRFLKYRGFKDRWIRQVLNEKP